MFPVFGSYGIDELRGVNVGTDPSIKETYFTEKAVTLHVANHF